MGERPGLMGMGEETRHVDDVACIELILPSSLTTVAIAVGHYNVISVGDVS